MNEQAAVFSYRSPSGYAIFWHGPTEDQTRELTRAALELDQEWDRTPVSDDACLWFARRFREEAERIVLELKSETRGETFEPRRDLELVRESEKEGWEDKFGDYKDRHSDRWI